MSGAFSDLHGSLDTGVGQVKFEDLETYMLTRGM